MDYCAVLLRQWRVKAFVGSNPTLTAYASMAKSGKASDFQSDIASSNLARRPWILSGILPVSLQVNPLYSLEYALKSGRGRRTCTHSIIGKALVLHTSLPGSSPGGCTFTHIYKKGKRCDKDSNIFKHWRYEARN